MQKRTRLLCDADTPGGPRLSKKADSVSHFLHRMLIHRDTSQLKEASANGLMYSQVQKAAVTGKAYLAHDSRFFPFREKECRVF